MLGNDALASTTTTRARYYRHLTSSLVDFSSHFLLLWWCGEDEVLSYLLDYEIYIARKDKLSAEKIPDDLDLRSRSIQQALIDRRIVVNCFVVVGKHR